MKKPHLVPPQAVRVWRGYRSPELNINDFFHRLSTVFVPATVEMQTPIGLSAYIPTIPGGMTGKPSSVPDETAILYWDSQETYKNGFKTLAVRTYTLTHGSVYTKESRADFPTLFSGNLIENEPSFLIDKPADWMNGNVHHLVAAKPETMSSDVFCAKVTAIITSIQENKSIAGGVVCIGEDYIVYWELSKEKSKGFIALENLVSWKLIANPNPTSLTDGLWEVWPGMDIKPGNSFNMQFERNSLEYAQ